MKQITFLGVLLLAGCSSPQDKVVPAVNKGVEVPQKPREPEEDKRLKLLRAEGLTDISLTGVPFFICGEDDSILFNTGFKGKKNGVEVEGALCGAMFKGWTVRYR